jgi:hypothetical protein
MDKPTRDRFEALLLALPFWNRERERRAFVEDTLWGHEITRHFRADGEGPTVASELLRLCVGYDAPMENGLWPACALLIEIRARGLATGDRGEWVQALSERLGCRTTARPKWPHAPYPGLFALHHWQAPIFFGRTVETRELLRRLGTDQGRRFLIVTGVSGSGKSSLVRAGVWAALETGQAPNLPGSDQWLITAMFPAAQGGDPFLALTSSLGQDRRFGWIYPGPEAERLKTGPGAFTALLDRVLADLPEDAEWLLILDQMEELFTPAAQAHRDAFLDLLLESVELARFRVLATVRSDFYPHCEAHPGLHEVLNREGGHYSVRAPGPLAMARMVAGPVEDLTLGVSMTIDTDLVERLVDDAVAEPGGLALLAFTLKDLYERRKQRGRMSLDAYLAPDFGGLKGVIGRRADRAMARAGGAGRAALPRVFSRLLTVQADGTATRRREQLKHWQHDPAARGLIEAFTARDTRLLVTGPNHEPTVEVAHEALLREWPLLRDWTEERREALNLARQLEAEAGAWAQQGHPDHLLWRHERLAPARDLLAEAGLLQDLERDPAMGDFLTPEAERLLAELLCHDTDHGRREDIGLRLAEIGDPRRGLGVIDGVPDIFWCPVPAGEVVIEAYGRFEVEPFHMAVFPITHAQFEAFLSARDGFGAQDWWEELTKEDPVSGPIRRHGNHPATEVSWYDATAFCRWLSARMRYEIRLPDEWQWQWAAQSAQTDFVYPWGPEWREGLANTQESGIGRTTAVGMYLGGRSEQGIYDLAGNVWEWCRNLYDDPKGTEPGAGGSRVVRGGSWDFDRGGARAVDRDDLRPFFRYVDLGFRVVCGSPIR